MGEDAGSSVCLLTFSVRSQTRQTKLSVVSVRSKLMSAQPVTSHHLLPHERWAATTVVDLQRTNPTAAVLRLRRNYGPEGIALLYAGCASGLPASVIGFVAGMLLVATSSDSGSLVSIAYWMLVVTICLASLGFVRAVQGILAGRRFRAGRPFVRRG